MSPQPVAGSTSGPELVAAFAECWDSLISLGRSLDEAQWAEPSLCPGWTCTDALIHLTSAEMGFADWTPSPDPPFDAINAATRALRQQSSSEVLAAFEAATQRRGEQLANMKDADLDREGWTPAGLGAYRRYMEIRVFDTWAHEQDIRVPLDLPGHLEGQGPVISLDGRARVVDEIADSECTVSTDFLTFMLLCCGRIEPGGPLADGRVALGGDVALAEAVARNLRFTI